MCKRLAIVFWIVGGLASIWIGKGLEYKDKYYGELRYNWGALLASLLGVFIFGMLFWIIGRIEDKMAERNEYLRRLTVAVEENLKGGWVCPECNTRNKSGAMTCCACGKYRI